MTISAPLELHDQPQAEASLPAHPSEPRLTVALSDAQTAAFEAHGFVHLGPVVSPAELEQLQQRIDQIMLGECRYEGMLMQLDSDTGSYDDAKEQTPGFKGATLSYRKIEQLERDPLFLSYLRSPIIAHIAQRYIGPDVAIYRSMFMNKPAERGTELPWHQDGGRIWDLTSDPLITVWLALDPATRDNGCVQVIDASHRLGLLSDYGHTLDEANVARHCPKDKVRHLEVEAGHAVLLHNWLIHRSGVNRTTRPRRAFSVCLMDAATRQRKHPNQAFPKLFVT